MSTLDDTTPQKLVSSETQKRSPPSGSSNTYITPAKSTIQIPLSSMNSKSPINLPYFRRGQSPNTPKLVLNKSTIKNQGIKRRQQSSGSRKRLKIKRKQQNHINQQVQHKIIEIKDFSKIINTEKKPCNRDSNIQIKKYVPLSSACKKFNRALKQNEKTFIENSNIEFYD